MKKIAFTLEINNNKLMQSCGEHFAGLISHSQVVYLSGELGSGKTTFVQGVLHGKGYFGKIKSPTYTIIESYSTKEFEIHHVDLYRIEKADELDIIGIRDYMTANTIWLIEWPEKGKGHLPNPDITITFEYSDIGRLVHFSANTVEGEVILDNCKEKNIFSMFHG